MAFVRRAILLSVGLAAGVGSAPYLCSTAPDPRPPFEGVASFLNTWTRDGLNSGRVAGNGQLSSTATSATASTEACGATLSEEGGFASAADGVRRLLDVATGRAARVRAAIIGTAHRTAAAASDENTTTVSSSPDAADGADDAERGATGTTTTTGPTAAAANAALRTVPHKLKGRFLHYAQRDPATGEFVLTLDGFVRCMLLLPEPEAVEATHGRGVMDGLPPPSPSSSLDAPPSWLQRLPEAVRRRFVHFFRRVDLDGTNTIDYAEFVVLFTVLSTRRQTLERAFHVFDLDDNGRLSESEFCRLLNTIMVDPVVQVRYTPTGNDQLESTRNAVETRGSSTSIMSRAGESRRNARQRQKHQGELSFEISSEVVRPLLFGPLPLHIGAPPGSMHYMDVPAAVRADESNTVKNQSNNNGGTVANPASGAVTQGPQHRFPVDAAAWWTDVGQKVQRAWSQLWQRESSQLGFFNVALPSRVAELQRMAEQDALLETVSYPTFLYRMDYLRWELRAIEFGLCDPDNRGFISVEDCRELLRRDHHADVVSATASSPGGAPHLSAHVTWQVYQKLFDVMKESTVILPALQLALDALPPVPADVLRGGAIPDAELKAATLAVQTVVQQTVRRYNAAAAAPSATETSSPSDSGEGESDVDGGTVDVVPALSPEPTAQERDNEEKSRLSSEPAASPEAAQKRAKRLQTTFVRPTALTWKQFSRAIAAVGTVPRLSEKEETLFRALLDEDASDSLSPTEFARLCAMKETFFAEQMPRFDEPRRNLVQQFFFCMQQLE